MSVYKRQLLLTTIAASFPFCQKPDIWYCGPPRLPSVFPPRESPDPNVPGPGSLISVSPQQSACSAVGQQLDSPRFPGLRRTKGRTVQPQPRNISKPQKANLGLLGLNNQPRFQLFLVIEEPNWAPNSSVPGRALARTLVPTLIHGMCAPRTPRGLTMMTVCQT